MEITYLKGVNMETIKVKLDKISDVQRFVVVASRYKDLDLKSGRYIVNASSLMGVLSLDLDKPIELNYLKEYEDNIQKDFVQWIVRE